MAMPTYSCRVCGADFNLPQQVVDRYPGWTPRLCRKHRGEPKSSPSQSAARKEQSRRALRTPAEVLDSYFDGPQDGVFTDGSAVPNPGYGGWGAVYVKDGSIVAEAYGDAPQTTNNRMELTALIQGASLVPEGSSTKVYSDSKLAVQTLTEWAVGWEKRGWKRKTGAVENLDLVKQAYALYRDRPELQLEWIAAHSGFRWNEYADALAAMWRRSD